MRLEGDIHMLPDECEAEYIDDDLIQITFREASETEANLEKTCQLVLSWWKWTEFVKVMQRVLDDWENLSKSGQVMKIDLGKPYGEG